MMINDIILLEAQPDGLGQGMLDKLFATYTKRDINDVELVQKFENGLQIAEYLFKIVGPKKLRWVCKQYNQDEFFFLHDLDEWKITLDEFDELCTDRRITIEKNIDKYKSITDLRNIIDELSGHHVALGSKFLSKVISGLTPYFNSGDAKLLYNSDEYIIYHPINFKSSSILNKGNLIGSVNLCTVLNDVYFEQYNNNGYLIYIIDKNRMYNCYINTTNNKNSEFADQQNNHNNDLSFLLNEFPQLTDIIKNTITEFTSVDVLRTICSPNEIKHMVEKNGELLSGIPDNERNYELCLTALSATPKPSVLIAIPTNLWQKKKLYDIITSNDLLSWRTIDYAPDPMQIQMIQRTPHEYSYITNPSEFVTDAFIRNMTQAESWDALSRIETFTPRNIYTLVTHHGNWLDVLNKYHPNLVTPKIEIAAIDFAYKDDSKYPRSAPTRLIKMATYVKSPQGQKHLAIQQANLIINYILHGGDPNKLTEIDNDMFTHVFNNFVTELHVNIRDTRSRSYISSQLDTFIGVFIQYMSTSRLYTLQNLVSQKKLIIDVMPNVKNLLTQKTYIDPASVNMSPVDYNHKFYSIINSINQGHTYGEVHELIDFLNNINSTSLTDAQISKLADLLKTVPSLLEKLPDLIRQRIINKQRGDAELGRVLELAERLNQ